MAQAAPIVRVAVEAKAPADMAALAAGLDLLHRADPLAEVTLQPSGEHVLGAAGPPPAASTCNSQCDVISDRLGADPEQEHTKLSPPPLGCTTCRLRLSGTEQVSSAGAHAGG